MGKAMWRAVAASVVVSVTVVAGAAHAAEPVSFDLSAQVALRDQLIRSAPVGSVAKVDPGSGRVVLRIPAAVPAGLAATVGRHRGRVVVEAHSGAVTFYSGVVGGHEIDSPVRPCNAGFIGYDNAGNQVIITAGHCVRNTYDWRRNGKLLGYAMGWIVSSEGDMGAIWITHNFVGQPLVNTVEGFSVVPRPVHSVQALPLSPATRVCKMARVTRYTCGNILAYNVSWTPEPGLVMNGLLETNVCARPGDSGGPLVTRQLVTAPESVTAIGVLSGGNGAACSDPNIRVYFQPVQPLMDKLELTLMTYW